MLLEKRISIDIVLNNIAITKIYNDSLGKHLRRVTYWETSRWKSSGYKAIISNGVEIIESKELREIQDEASNVKILVIPTNEEIEIAKQTYLVLN